MQVSRGIRAQRVNAPVDAAATTITSINININSNYISFAYIIPGVLLSGTLTK